ncbi:MAG TPA: class I SAM-dependent methyltransferase [Pseudonocardiaceae bacterium]|jgi:SAM-dependent methyltransferase|nr:class I SAM-dependent methyltransferase [Pseudonocardiaceae bacterium]
MEPEPGFDPAEHARRASSFGTQAAAYAEFRPTYPVAMVDWGLASVRAAAGLAVLDLGAGTGKLTEVLLGMDLDVTAVEPDPAMLAQLRERFPYVRSHQGPAEQIPLPDDSVNAVVVGQALHWFDLDRAVPEIRRVLRPGGVLVTAWNGYDDRVPWVARMCAMAESVTKTQNDNDDLLPAIYAMGRCERGDFEHRMTRTVDTLVSTVATQSGMLVSTPRRRADVLARVRALLLSDPATATGEFSVPLVTTAFRVLLD